MSPSEVQFIFIDNDDAERRLFLKDLIRSKILNPCVMFSSVTETLSEVRVSGEIQAHARCIIFMDWMIPGEAGRENAHRLREAFPNAAIVVLSVHPPLKEIQDLPVSACLLKPIKLKDIISMMDDHSWLLVKFFEHNTG